MRSATGNIGLKAGRAGPSPARPAVLGSKPHFARFLLLCSTAISEALNGIHIDQILLMQDTIIDVRQYLRSSLLTISEIVSREIDPVLFILLLTTEQFPSNGLKLNCHVPYAVNN